MVFLGQLGLRLRDAFQRGQREFLDWTARQRLLNAAARNADRLAQLPVTQQTDLTRELATTGNALAQLQASLDRAKRNVDEFRPSTGKKLTVEVGAPLIATCALIGVPVYGAYRAITGKHLISPQEVAEVFQGGRELNAREAQAYADFFNLSRKFGDGIAELTVAYNQLAQAILDGDGQKAERLLRAYEWSVTNLQQMEGALARLHDSYQSIAGTSGEAYQLSRGFMINAALSVVSLGAGRLLGAAGRLVPQRVAASRAGQALGKLVQQGALPALRPTPINVALTAGIVYGLDLGGVRTIYRAWQNGQECVQLKEGLFLVHRDSSGRYIEMPLEGGVQKTYLEETPQGTLYAGAPVQVRTASYGDFLNVVTGEWLKVMAYGAAGGVVLKGLGMTWHAARGTEHVLRAVLATGTPQRVIGILEQTGINVAENPQAAQATLKLLEKPQSTAAVYRALRKLYPAISKETAEQVAATIKESWTMARQALREERLGQIGAATQWVVQQVQAVAGVAL